VDLKTARFLFAAMASGDATLAENGLECLKQWAETLGADMDAVLGEEGRTPSVASSVVCVLYI
jgi:pyrroloquinoline quinone (PQQ) biosynthesis protein C